MLVGCWARRVARLSLPALECGEKDCGNKSSHVHGSRCCVASLRVLIIWRANYDVHHNLKNASPFSRFAAVADEPFLEAGRGSSEELFRRGLYLLRCPNAPRRSTYATCLPFTAAARE